MKTIRKYSRNELAGILTLALAVVVAYSAWGSYILHHV